MKEFISHSQPFELVLAILGIVLFLALLFILIWNAIHKRSFAALLPFFILPIGMIAYPTIKSLKVPGIEIEIINRTLELSQKVTNNPSDTAAIRDLKLITGELKGKDQLSKNPQALVAVVKAEQALGRYDSAAVYLGKADKIAPNSNEVESVRKSLRKDIKVRNTFEKDVGQLNKTLGELKQKPGDSASVNRIHAILGNLNAPPFIYSNQAMIIAKSLAVAGYQQQSIKVLNTLKENGPLNVASLDGLKDSIETQTFQRKFYKNEVSSRRLRDTSSFPKSLQASKIRIYKPF